MCHFAALISLRRRRTFFGKLEIKNLLHFWTYVFIKKFTGRMFARRRYLPVKLWNFTGQWPVTGTYFEAWLQDRPRAYLQDRLQFPPSWLQKNKAGVIVPVFIEFTVFGGLSTSRRRGSTRTLFNFVLCNSAASKNVYNFVNDLFSLKPQDALLDDIDMVEDLELRDSILPVRDMSDWIISIPKVAFKYHGSKEVMIVLCCAVLCYVMLCYVMLCYVMLCYAVLWYAVLCCVMVCYGMLCCVVLFLCCVVLCYAVLCFVMLCCVVLWFVMLCCVVLYYAVLCSVMLCCVVLYCSVLHCVVLCCVVLCYTVLWCVVLCCVIVLCCVVLCCAVL
jgi:hypothetical protein